MNRTKKIYFLAAFVMIIGCYALNKSYSLFVATEEQEAVTSKVPILESSLSMPTITLAGNEECLIKQTINNTSEVAINYSLTSTGTNYEIKLVDDTTNTALGSLESSSTKDIYLYLKNTSSNENTITFNLNKKYTTLNNDLTTNITDTYTVISYANPYAYNTELLSYNIINNYLNSDNYNGTVKENSTYTLTELNDLFGDNIKILLPLKVKLEPKTDPTKQISAADEKVLATAEDDYGTTYYYRGAVDTNYVSFADKLWRIVRINGDGSIRLVLDDVANDSSGSTLKVYYNMTNLTDNAYVGYMYGSTGGDSYDGTHENKNDSYIKKQVDSWYKTNIVDTNNTDYVADTLFCNDKALASDGIGGVTTQLGYRKNATYYASSERLYYSTGTTSITTSKPTFKCAESATNDYSRFTVNAGTLSNGNKTNGKLTYPIALLSSDEVVYAGAYKSGQNNTTYYLYKSNLIYDVWLLSPHSAKEDGIYVEIIFYGSKLSIGNAYTKKPFRPVLNLKANILKKAGDGTKNNPYTVKLS